MSDFFGKLAEILDEEAVAETDVLMDFVEWDSLSALSVIAMLDADYGVNVTAMDLQKVKTVADLAELANA